MKLLKEQQFLQTLINKAWEDNAFKEELVANPVAVIEKVTGEKLNIPEGKQLVVRDQTNEQTIYINIPAEVKMDDVELNEEQLEVVAGGHMGIDYNLIQKLRELQNLRGGEDPNQN